MKVDYEIGMQDYIDFNLYHLKNSEVYKRSLFIQRYLVPIIFLIMPFVLYKISEIPFSIWFICFSISTVLWIIFYPKYFLSVAKKRIPKMVSEGKNSDLFGKHSIVLDEKGLIDKSENGENSLNWTGVDRIVMTENYFFIYVSSISAYIVPKRFFPNNKKAEEFYQYVKEMIEKKRIKDPIACDDE